MIDARDSVINNENRQLRLPPPARFDDNASANARPVQPLRSKGPVVLTQRLRDLGHTLSARTNALAVVVILGLTIGAASGAMLASRRTSLESTPQAQPSLVETSGMGAITQEALPTGGAFGAEAAATAMQSAVKPVRFRRQRTAPRANERPQAYRIAVLN